MGKALHLGSRGDEGSSMPTALAFLVISHIAPPRGLESAPPILHVGIIICDGGWSLLACAPASAPPLPYLRRSCSCFLLALLHGSLPRLWGLVEWGMLSGGRSESPQDSSVLGRGVLDSAGG